MTKDEFARRVTQMEKTLYRVSFGVLRRESDREDAVQSAILKAWEKLPGLRQEQYFETWMVRILLNECYSIGRENSRLVDIEQYRLPETGQSPDNRALRDGVLALRDDYRLPVILHYIEGYDLREISGILDVPVGTVKSRLHRARQMLKSELEEVQQI